MYMNEPVIDRIQWLMNLPEMHSNPCKGGFFATSEEKSIMRWTCTELALTIMDHPNQDAFETIDRFLMQMVYFLENAPSQKVKDTFQVVVDTIETIQFNL